VPANVAAVDLAVRRVALADEPLDVRVVEVLVPSRHLQVGLLFRRHVVAPSVGQALASHELAGDDHPRDLGGTVADGTAEVSKIVAARELLGRESRPY
jgi:hypothetical protein